MHMHRHCTSTLTLPGNELARREQGRAARGAPRAARGARLVACRV